MIATISSKGQVTIPHSVRSAFRLHTGDRIEFVLISPDRLEVRPYRKSVTALRGMVRHDGPPLSLVDMERAIGKGGEE